MPFQNVGVSLRPVKYLCFFQMVNIAVNCISVHGSVYGGAVVRIAHEAPNHFKYADVRFYVGTVNSVDESVRFGNVVWSSPFTSPMT